MTQNILNTFIRGVAVYVLALKVARLMGRKLISQMTFFDFVVGVTMGTITGDIIMGPDSTPLTSAVSLITLSILAIFTGFVSIKSYFARKVINSSPIALIKNGDIVEDNMRSSRITLNELTMKLREKNIFNLADVEFAIMETDGQLSVLPK